MNFTVYVVLFSIALSMILSVFPGQSKTFPLKYILTFDVTAVQPICLFTYFSSLKQWKSSCRLLSESFQELRISLSDTEYTEECDKCPPKWALHHSQEGKPSSFFAAPHSREAILIEGNIISFGKRIETNQSWTNLHFLCVWIIKIGSNSNCNLAR